MAMAGAWAGSFQPRPPDRKWYPGSLVLTPTLTPEQSFRCREVGGNGVIPYVERDRIEWARQDSNLRPWDYESLALTN